MNFGLRLQDLDEIIRILKSSPFVEEAILFGSRAKGTFKNGSDIDLAVKGKGIDHSVIASLSFLLNEESAMPYFFDIVQYEGISDKELVEHIKRVGQCIYLKEN